jgi:Fungal hydrophobin
MSHDAEWASCIYKGCVLSLSFLRTQPAFPASSKPASSYQPLLLPKPTLFIISITMFARLSAVALIATLFAGAIAAPAGNEYEYESCNGGEVQCCNSAQTTESMKWEHKTLLSILKIDIGDVTGLVGVGCSGVNVAGIGGGSKWLVLLLLIPSAFY